MLDAIQIVASQRNHDLSKTIAALYLISAPVLLQVMRDAAEQENVRELLRAAEALTLSSAGLGAFRLANLCRALVQLPSKAGLADAPEQLDRIQQALAIVCATLTQQQHLLIDSSSI
jgi:HPt (histidine-containing phosphotransfer) domain-containing protein